LKEFRWYDFSTQPRASTQLIKDFFAFLHFASKKVFFGGQKNTEKCSQEHDPTKEVSGCSNLKGHYALFTSSLSLSSRLRYVYDDGEVFESFSFPRRFLYFF
jgi:hypothetical protein